MSNFTKLMQQAASGVSGGDFYPYTIDNSVRFNPGDSPHLYRNSYSCSRTTWTLSFWLKRSGDPTTGTYKYIFDQGTTSGTGNTQTYLYQDKFYAAYTYVAPTDYGIELADKVRDSSGWYHFVVVYDTTNATASERIRIYKNGTRADVGTYNDQPPQNYQGQVGNSSYPFYIGRYSYSIQYNLDGYLADWNFIDGQALDSSYFGETKNGVWIPKSYSGTYSGNSYHLDFADSSDLGKDVSGNGIHFTSSGLTSSDQVSDTPTNNFPTWNSIVGSLSSGTPTLSNGNLDVSTPGAGSGHTYATMAIPESGDWYWEVTWNTGTYWLAGIAAIDRSTVYVPLAQSIMYHSNGFFYEDATSHTGYTAASTGDVIGIRANVDAGTVSFYLNNTLLDTFTYDVKGMFPHTGDASGTPGVNTISATGNFGQSSFTYTPPGTSVALCTANLPEPTIGPNSSTQSDENFNTVLYTGNGSSSHAITNLDFQPDFVWIKRRDAADANVLHDAVRGNGGSGDYLYLRSDSSNAETQQSDGDGLLSLDTNGFTVGYNNSTAWNGSSATYVAWNWKGNGSGSSNTDGDITSTVSANQDAGFSIVTYTGNGTTGSTVGHGLGKTPNFIMVKKRTSTGNWGVWHTSLSGNTYVTLLNATNAELVPTDAFFTPQNNNSSVFGLGFNANTNTSAVSYVAYCFAEVEGFSSFGSYTGNGSTDGPFVYTGFRPAWVMTKRTDSTSSWTIHDTDRQQYNKTTRNVLFADDSLAEVPTSPYPFDMLSNGFKVRHSGGGENASGGSYIYMAFGESFKYSNAR